jgi:hypothetical protein
MPVLRSIERILEPSANALMYENSNLENHGVQKHGNSRDYVFRVVGLLIGNVIGLIGLYFVAHLTEDWNSWANVVAVWVLGLASLNVVIISALTASETIDTMRHQEIEMRLGRETTQKQLTVMENSLVEMQKQRELFAHQVAQSSAQIDLMRSQVVQMIEQGETMQEGLKQNREFFDLVERPALGIERIDLRWEKETFNSEIFVIIRNTGKSYAKKIRSRFAFMFHAAAHPDEPYAPLTLPEDVIGLENAPFLAVNGVTNSTSPRLDGNIIREVFARRAWLYFWLHLEYEGSTGKEYFLEHYSRYSIDTGQFHPCDTHNDAT